MTVNLWRLTFDATAESAEKFGHALEKHVLAVSWYEISEADNHWVVEATLDGKPHQFMLYDTTTPMPEKPLDESTFREILAHAARVNDLPEPIIKLEKLPETDWLEQTWRNFPPRQIGPFYVYGSHTQAIPPADLIGLEINAATAFGSGEHETTAGCLLTLHDLKEAGRTFVKPLDMGCGSGILAMAAAKLWDVSVLAVDNDPESVRVTADNAQMNGCGDLVHALCNEGFEGTIVQGHGPFDLIIANILANPLCIMASDMVKNLLPGGCIILSGLLHRQRDEVIAAYERAGAIFVSQKIIGDWATLSLTR